jgi:hypothetical protein
LGRFSYRGKNDTIFQSQNFIRKKITEIFEEERCKNNIIFEILKFLQNLGFGVNIKKVYKTPPNSPTPRIYTYLGHAL